MNKPCRHSLEIKTGTKLIREYKGEKHELIALEKGFEYSNKPYKSLSAIQILCKSSSASIQKK